MAEALDGNSIGGLLIDVFGADMTAASSTCGTCGTVRPAGSTATYCPSNDPACPKVPGDGTFRALNGTVSSGPTDSWICPAGSHFYQIYPNASKLVGYAIQPDASVEEITSATIPYQTPQGLTGF